VHLAEDSADVADAQRRGRIATRRSAPERPASRDPGESHGGNLCSMRFERSGSGAINKRSAVPSAPIRRQPPCQQRRVRVAHTRGQQLLNSASLLATVGSSSLQTATSPLSRGGGPKVKQMALAHRVWCERLDCGWKIWSDGGVVVEIAYFPPIWREQHVAQQAEHRTGRGTRS